ncbi:MAG: hypothetical protein EXR72_21110 [Myxococcales bacterium]|nr:hypothetical protein [Myxococcales bacterium]
MADKTPSPSLLRTPGIAIADRDLRVAVAIHDELLRRGQSSFFPADLPGEEVHEHLRAHLDAMGERAVVGRTERSLVAEVRTDDRTAVAMVGRLTELVNGAWPPGCKQRGDFFSGGAGEHAPCAQLAAMASGIKLHGLPGLPQDLAEPVIRKLAQRLAIAESARADTGKQRQNVVAFRRNMRPRTREIARRMSAILRGHYGKHSKELAAYGLRMRTVSPKPRRKAVPVVVAMPSNGVVANG